MTYRSFIGVTIVLALAALSGRLGDIGLRHLRLHGLRNLAHFTGQNLWFYALTLIPLAQLFALEFTSPIWVLLLSPLFLGERLTLIRIASALIGFVGILIVTRPTPDSINLGIILAAVSAICFALTTLATKRLTRTEPITNILFHLTVMQAVMGLICAGYDLDIAWPSADALPFVFVVGLGGLLAHFCIAKALSLAPATVVVPVDFIRLPAIAVIGMLLYSEPLDVFVLIGAVVIFAANYLNIWTETRKT